MEEIAVIVSTFVYFVTERKSTASLLNQPINFILLLFAM